jgi:UDP-sulfoquinovose synthase
MDLAEEFPLRRYNFNPGTLGTPARRTRRAMAIFDEETEGWPIEAYRRGRSALGAARQEAISLWGDDQLAIGPGTTLWCNLLLDALAGHRRRERVGALKVLTTGHEHDGGAGALEHHPDLSVAYVGDEYLLDPDDFGRQVAALNPEVVFLSQVTWTEGRHLPVRELIGEVRRRTPEAWVILDAAQAVGLCQPMLGIADFTVASGHKWLNGPPGTGFCWLGARPIQELGGLFFVGHSLDESWPLRRFEPGGGQDFSRFAGLEAALSLYAQLGIEAAARRSRQLANHLARGLNRVFARHKIPHTFFDGSEWVQDIPDLPSGTCVVRFPTGFDPYLLYSRLDTRAVHMKCIKGQTGTGQPLNQLRFGLPWFEQEERLDTALGIVDYTLREGAG